MKKTIQEFTTGENDPLNIFRTIVLFGKNVSTYKFALGSVLMKQDPKSEIRITDITQDFLKELYSHYQQSPKQWTGGENSVTRAFDTYANGGNWEEMVKVAEKSIYNNVFDAFHNIGGSSIKDECRLFEYNKVSKILTLTDTLNKILHKELSKSTIINENQTRWRLVEEAWRNSLSPNILEYDNGEFHSYNLLNPDIRTNLRSAVNVLLPYQKGRCFYCNKEINQNASVCDHDFPDVDHVFPFSSLIRRNIRPLRSNGIWNLVIACQECNRGNSGKFDSPPSPKYFQKLLTRNILFTEEHRHSLKNSILITMHCENAADVEKRMHFISNQFRFIKGWEAKVQYL
jgi:hypothetical protein